MCPSSTYLGLAKKNDKYKVHFEKRMSKARSASFALTKIFYRLPHLPVNTHLNITRACIKAVFLYGSEIGSKNDTKKTVEQMNILLRRHLRHILRSKISTANETLQLDAGWNRTQTEILVKKIRLYAEVNDGSRGTLANEVAQKAKESGTHWFSEIKEELGEHYTALLDKPTYKKRNYIISVTRKKDTKAQMDRLEQKCPTSTELFRKLNELHDCKHVKTYIKCNPHMRNAIRLIHAVRAGNSDLKGKQYPRHQAADDKCRLCQISYERETPQHVIEE